ncbi:MAG: hypothetical protein ACPHIY_00810 [Candidatus Thalassarchaeaceae archaeon]
MSTESIGFLNHESCWTTSRLGDSIRPDSSELHHLDEAFGKLAADELDIAIIPAKIVHGRQLDLLSKGLVVSGAMNQNRPFHVMVSDDRVRHLPRSSIVLSSSKIVRRQLRRLRRDLRVLSPKAWAGINEVELPQEGLEVWMEGLRRSGEIDAFTLSRDSFDKFGLKARRFALWPEPKEAGGSFFLPPIYSDLPLLITREGFPKARCIELSGEEGLAAWHVMNELFGSESDEMIEGIGILVKHRSVSSLLQQAESTRDLALEQSCRDSEGDMVPEETRLMVRIEYVSDDGTRTFRLDKIIRLDNLHGGCVTMDREWRSVFHKLRESQPEHPRWGPASPAFFND